VIVRGVGAAISDVKLTLSVASVIRIAAPFVSAASDLLDPSLLGM
jgi:hypothetical protein